MEDRLDAARSLERIRALMERAGKFSHLSATSAYVAGALAGAGALGSHALGVHFNQPSDARTLAWIWGSVLVLALGQSVGFTVADARRRGDPFWGPLTEQVVRAMLPAFLIGATFTAYGLRTGQLDLLPPFWSLAYGASLMGLGLYAGRRIQLVGLLFILAGALALFFFRPYGLRMMLASFGGGHLLLGVLIAWKRRASVGLTP
jgi:hypothetical protein